MSQSSQNYTNRRIKKHMVEKPMLLDRLCKFLSSDIALADSFHAQQLQVLLQCSYNHTCPLQNRFRQQFLSSWPFLLWSRTLRAHMFSNDSHMFYFCEFGIQYRYLRPLDALGSCVGIDELHAICRLHYSANDGPSPRIAVYLAGGCKWGNFMHTKFSFSLICRHLPEACTSLKPKL